MRLHSAANGGGRVLLVVLTSALALTVVSIVGIELAQLGDPPAPLVALLIASLLLCWTFANSIFALHYAKLYYPPLPVSPDRGGGIEFPGTADPSYREFFYFAFTLGMTFQTSDTKITKSEFRRIVILHSLIMFAFTIGLVASTVNLFGPAV
jgi:uncharacterized membrane protein